MTTCSDTTTILGYTTTCTLPSGHDLGCTGSVCGVEYSWPGSNWPSNKIW